MKHASHLGTVPTGISAINLFKSTAVLKAPNFSYAVAAWRFV